MELKWFQVQNQHFLPYLNHTWKQQIILNSSRSHDCQSLQPFFPYSISVLSDCLYIYSRPSAGPLSSSLPILLPLTQVQEMQLSRAIQVMPPGHLVWSAANDSPISYRIKFHAIQIRSLSQKSPDLLPKLLLGFSSTGTGLTRLHVSHLRAGSHLHRPLCEQRRFHIGLPALLLREVSRTYIHI